MGELSVYSKRWQVTICFLILWQFRMEDIRGRRREKGEGEVKGSRTKFPVTLIFTPPALRMVE